MLKTNGMGDASPRPRPAAPGFRWWDFQGFFADRGHADRRRASFSLLVSRESGHGCFLGDAWASFTILGGPREKSRQMLRLIPATSGRRLWLCFLLWPCRAGTGGSLLWHSARAHPVSPRLSNRLHHPKITCFLSVLPCLKHTFPLFFGVVFFIIIILVFISPSPLLSGVVSLISVPHDP